MKKLKEWLLAVWVWLLSAFKREDEHLKAQDWLDKLENQNQEVYELYRPVRRKVITKSKYNKGWK